MIYPRKTKKPLNWPWLWQTTIRCDQCGWVGCRFNKRLRPRGRCPRCQNEYAYYWFRADSLRRVEVI